MMIDRLLLRLKPYIYFMKGREYLNDPHYCEVIAKDITEVSKRPLRTEIINFLLSQKEGDTNYLEIGVRNPDHNFHQIKATNKYSVDPGLEFIENPVDFKMTSDEFFQKLSAKEILSGDIKFDVIFIDGLHLAQQVDRDIENSIRFIKDDGFVVLHDCNPITEWHARERSSYFNTPALGVWNGTTWKAFLKWRFNSSVYSCCIDSDYGVGVLSRKHNIGKSIEPTNFFFEFGLLENNRKSYLNLIDFEDFKMRF